MTNFSIIHQTDCIANTSLYLFLKILYDLVRSLRYIYPIVKTRSLKLLLDVFDKSKYLSIVFIQSDLKKLNRRRKR